MAHFSLNQAGAAEIVGMRHTIVSRWLSGEAQMPQSTAMAFQAALGVRWQWLLTGEGEMLLAKAENLTDNARKLIEILPYLTDSEQQFLIGEARGMAAAKAVK